MTAGLTLFAMVISMFFGVQVGLAVATRRDPASSARELVVDLRFPGYLAPPYDWAVAGSGLERCKMCNGSGRADWTDPLTGSGIAGGVCPCGAVPKVVGQ